MGGNGIKEVASDLRLRCKAIYPLKATDDFDDSYFMGFAAISRKIRVGGNLELEKTCNTKKES